MTQTLTTELLSVARAMRDYIDALPSYVVASLPTMPGFDRDWADEVIEAANREAQPVAHVSEESFSSDGTSDIMTKNLPIGTALFTEQPVSVVPEEAYSDDCPDLYPSQPDAWAAGYNACRDAMLAQPVSQGYRLPEGFKLMPIEITDEIAEAIAMEARCCGGIALCIYEAALAAVPDSN